MSVQTRMIRALKMPFVWVGFLLIILAFGMTDVLSGWMVSFQNEKRGMPDAAARYNLSGLWAGESSLRLRRGSADLSIYPQELPLVA
jgi:fucose permease